MTLDESEEWVAADGLVFNNEYEADDVDVDLGGMKNLEGRDLVDGEFEFSLFESDLYGAQGALIETVANLANEFNFAALTFEDGEEGIYYYLIKEVQGTLGGVTYDATMFHIKVVITDDFEGNLEAEVRLMDAESWIEFDLEDIAFNNEYNAEQIGVTLTGMKNFGDRDLVDGAFQFSLFASDISGMEGSLIETVGNVGANFSFTQMTYEDGEEGTYYYLIKEVQGTEEGIVYDTAVYLVIVTIEDNLLGELTATVDYLIVEDTEEGMINAESIVFENYYIAIEVDKMVAESSFSEAGDLIHYSFSVINTGDLPFVKLTVNDPRLGIVDLEIDLSADPLLPGDIYVHLFTEPYVVVEADIEAEAPIINTITVIGETEEGYEAEDDDSVTVPFEQTAPFIPPIISLVKKVKEDSFSKAGDLLHYYFTVTNEGVVPIVKLTLNDPKLGINNVIIDLSATPLMPGESYTYEFSQPYVVTEADVEAEKIVNVLRVKGESPEGAEVEVEDDLTTPMELILPHVPKTGENFNHWAAIAVLLLGGAVAVIAIMRRRKSN